MKFLPAKCPNCQGDLQIPDNKDIVKCMYCGGEIIVRDVIKIKNDYENEIKLMEYEADKLIKDFENGNKKEKYLEEAINLFQKILVIDNNNESVQEKLNHAKLKLFRRYDDDPKANILTKKEFVNNIHKKDIESFLSVIEFSNNRRHQEIFIDIIKIYQNYCKAYPEKYIPLIEEDIFLKINSGEKEETVYLPNILGRILTLILVLNITKKENFDIQERIVRLCDIALKGNYNNNIKNINEYGAAILSDNETIELFEYIKSQYQSDVILKNLAEEYDNVNEKIKEIKASIRAKKNHSIEYENKEAIKSRIWSFAKWGGVLGFFSGIYSGCESCFSSNKGEFHPSVVFTRPFYFTIFGVLAGIVIGYLVGYSEKKKLE